MGRIVPVITLMGALALGGCLPTGELKTYATDAAKVGNDRAARVTQCMAAPEVTWLPPSATGGEKTTLMALRRLPEHGPVGPLEHLEHPIAPGRLPELPTTVKLSEGAKQTRDLLASHQARDGATVMSLTGRFDFGRHIELRSKLLSNIQPASISATPTNLFSELPTQTPLTLANVEEALKRVEALRPEASMQFEAADLFTRKIIEHDAYIALHGIYEKSATRPASRGTQAAFSVSASRVADLSSTINEAAMADAFSVAAEHHHILADLASMRSMLRSGPGATAEVQTSTRHRTLADGWNLAARYLGAYFRNGRFIDGRVSLPKLEDAVPEVKNLPKAVRDALEQEFAKVNALKLVPQDGGFITRFGVKHVIAPYSVELNFAALTPPPDQATAPRLLSLSTVDFSTIAADVTRVVLEALFDNWNGLPATDSATGALAEDGFSPLPKLSDLYQPNTTIRAASVGGQWSKVTTEDMNQMLKIANQAETTTGAIASQLVRGVNFLAINNEALAKVLETAISVPVRKGSELVTWCWFASRPVTAARGPDSLLHMPIASTPLKIER